MNDLDCPESSRLRPSSRRMSLVQALKPANKASPLPAPGCVTTLMSGRHCRATAMVSSTECPSTSTTSLTQSGKRTEHQGKVLRLVLDGDHHADGRHDRQLLRDRPILRAQALAGRPVHPFSRDSMPVRRRRPCPTLRRGPLARRKFPSHADLPFCRPTPSQITAVLPVDVVPTSLNYLPQPRQMSTRNRPTRSAWPHVESSVVGSGAEETAVITTVAWCQYPLPQRAHTPRRARSPRRAASVEKRERDGAQHVRTSARVFPWGADR